MGRPLSVRNATRGPAAGVPAPAAGMVDDFHVCVGAFETEFDFVYHVLRRHGVNDPDAEDLVQDVFLVMWRHWAAYDRQRPLRPWLAGIAFRVAYNYRHRLGRETPGGLMDPRDQAPSPEDRIASASARSLVTRVLAGMSEKHRSLIVAHDIDGVPMKEIADALGVPLFTAHTRLRAARLAFAKAVKRHQTVSAARAALPALEQLRAAQAAAAVPPAPEPTRRRALGRVRSVLLLPGLGLAPDADGQPTEESSPPWTAAPGPGPSMWFAGAATVAALGLLAFVWWHAPAAPSGPAPAARVTPAEPAPAGAATVLASMASQASAAGRPLARLAPAPAEPRAATGLNQGLVGYWRFDDGYGSTTARDLSGNGNDCLLRNVDPAQDWTDGPLGGALAFHGTGWLECPRVEALARISSAITIGVWVKRTGRKRNVRALVTRQFENQSLDTFHFGFSEESLALRSRLAGRAAFARFPSERGRWVHVAASRDENGVARLFLDGHEVRRKVGDRASLGGGTNPMIVGGGTNGPDPRVRELLEGALDELVIYDRALADDEIRALAAGTQPRQAP
jgi:RNA polymerase sigma-70 factor, ECF subfamily